MPPKKERISVKCLECGKEIFILQNQYDRGNGRYCSKECLGKSKRHGSTLYCALCDSPFYRRFGEQDIGVRENQFCSNDCYTDWRTMKIKDSTYSKIRGRHAHRIVAEEYIRRELVEGEVVHHRDNNKRNNSPSNLFVFPSQSLHARCHFGIMEESELLLYSLEAVKNEAGTR